MDIYVSADLTIDPNEFQNTMEFKKQAYLKLSSASFPNMGTFVVAVRVNGITLNPEAYYMTTVKAYFQHTTVT